MGTRRLFGTDGIRGRANAEPMTPETMMRVAMAAADRFDGSGQRTAIIAKDTRLSGYLLEPALVCGFIALGWEAVTVGPLPTPAVSVLTRSLRANLGVMLSASHNPFHDNGIKIFGPDGYKLSDAQEQGVEAVMAEVESRRASPEALGRARRMEDAQGRYIEVVKSSFPQGMRLDGLRIAVDCANGAAYRVAPAVLSELGAEVIPVAVSPDGMNINEACGAAHPQTICRAVRDCRADIGLSFDGDADRLVLSDETGRPVDGDRVMALIAAAWQRCGQLRGGAVAATVMSNLGLERYLDTIGLRLERTRVGDRYVVEHMRARALNVGGEQSGHIVLRDFCATGDGLLAALQVLAELVRSGKPASEALALFEPLPQRLENVRYGARDPLMVPAVQRAVADAEAQLDGIGRLLIRKSGTEPLIRIMAEAEDEHLVGEVVEGLAADIRAAV
ncbi:MAG: phosphoglucosamine mutase [Alphaproteobacteria bacterium]|nr:phosphoglucosamine mutase [Alphaproteobacteria bacterium]